MKTSTMQFAALLLSTLCLLTSAHGQITGVTAGTDLTGGGTSGNVTLNLNTSKVPQLATANTFTGNQTVTGNMTASGAVTGSSFNIGSSLFAYGSSSNSNAFLGFAGNTTMTGDYNTASGFESLLDNTTGFENTASGYLSLVYNTTGILNTGFGGDALLLNSSGNFNTAIGAQAGLTADGSYMTGSNNTAVGAYSLFGTGTLTNAAAI